MIVRVERDVRSVRQRAGREGYSVTLKVGGWSGRSRVKTLRLEVESLDSDAEGELEPKKKGVGPALVSNQLLRI